jgi:hypothetical protein
MSQVLVCCITCVVCLLACSGIQYTNCTAAAAAATAAVAADDDATYIIKKASGYALLPY